MSFDPSFTWLPRAARRQLVAVACIGFLLGVAVTLVWASFLPSWLLLFLIVPAASIIFWTLAGQIGREVKLDYLEDLGPPAVEVHQVWSDPTAPHELVRVRYVAPGGTITLIERIRGSGPETLHKPFRVATSKLAARFDLLRCRDCNQPTGQSHLGTCAYSAMRTGKLPSPLVEIEHCIEESRAS